MDVDNRKLVARVAARLKELGLDWPDLSREIPEAYPQLVYNWRKRGIPAEWHPAIAKVLGWTVEELLGQTAPEEPEWPFPDIPQHRIRRLTGPEILRLQAALLEEIDELETARREKNRQRKRAG